MPCPICNKPVGDADHRMCVFELLKQGKIKTSKEWETLAKKPVTIVIGKVIRKVRKQEE